jgi:hypothetical protein
LCLNIIIIIIYFIIISNIYMIKKIWSTCYIKFFSILFLENLNNRSTSLWNLNFTNICNKII